MLRRGNMWRREEAMACERVGVLPGGKEEEEECWVFRVWWLLEAQWYIASAVGRAGYDFP